MSRTTPIARMVALATLTLGLSAGLAGPAQAQSEADVNQDPRLGQVADFIEGFSANLGAPSGSWHRFQR